MGTRATITVRDESGTYANIYCHWDGYPGGLGVDIAKVLVEGGPVVNGIGLGDGVPRFNGPGCLAAQLVAALKKEPGGIYLATDARGEEYHYEIAVQGWPAREAVVTVTVEGGGDKLFSGSIEDFSKFCAGTDDE